MSKQLPKGRRTYVAKGCYHIKMPALLWVSIGLDEDTFSEIRSIAVQRQCSFNNVARELIEFGLETTKGEA
ncbi:hypothetical protein [Acetobacter persici]|uniref:hypothetical protein n=1 Tax=Acetobacter persici TaxID=1076596 RepID=UPI001BA5D1B6|nr:hypothetical protein [Acetobacter persici]MBS1014457.1 hypothetical protein [Acetobacter persici]